MAEATSPGVAPRAKSARSNRSAETVGSAASSFAKRDWLDFRRLASSARGGPCAVRPSRKLPRHPSLQIPFPGRCVPVRVGQFVARRPVPLPEALPRSSAAHSCCRPTSSSRGADNAPALMNRPPLKSRKETTSGRARASRRASISGAPRGSRARPWGAPSSAPPAPPASGPS
jgi:hypothetical protein